MLYYRDPAHGLAPDWLRFVSSLNPLTTADAARASPTRPVGRPSGAFGIGLTGPRRRRLASRAFSRANA
jgi:hypothetical protein